MPFKLHPLHLMIIGCSFSYCHASDISSEDEYVFQGVSLFGEQNKALNLAKFQDKNYIEEGQYFWNVSINNEDGKQYIFMVKKNAQSDKNEVCFSLEQLKKMGIQTRHIHQAKIKECIFASEISPFLRYEIDQNELKLKLTVPDALVFKFSEAQASEAGANSFFSNYNYNYSRADQHRIDVLDEQHFLSLQSGLNLFGWYFRHQGSVTVDNDKTYFQAGSYTLYRDILSKKARIALGHVNVAQSNSVPVLGVMFENDPLMRSESERYYTPIIENVAQTHALVKVFQNERLLLEKSVTPGPFKIERVTGLDRYGDLKVEIHEATQQVRTFTVPYSMQLSLLRQKQLNYRVAYGDFVKNYQPTGQKVLQAGFEYGLRHNTSISGSFNYAEGYVSGSWGAIYNNNWGGFALQADYALADVINSKGYKFEVNYQARPITAKTNINVRATYNSPDFPSFSNALETHAAKGDYLSISQSIRQDWGVNFSQNLGRVWGSLSVNALWRNYWNSSKQYAQLQLSYANTWKKLQYSMSYSHTYDSQEDSDRTLFLSVSLPWSKLSTQTQQQRMPQKISQTSIQYSDTYGHDQQWKYSLNAGSYKDESGETATVGANLTYAGPKLQSTFAINHSDENTQMSFNSHGALVVHRHGVTLAKGVSDTFAIAHIQTGNDLHGSKQWGEGYDRWGNAIYNNMTPYQDNSIAFNPSKLPLNVNLESMAHELKPRRFSTPMVEFKAEHHENVVLILDVEPHQEISLGATLETDNGETFGTAGQSNQIFLQNRKYLKSGLRIRWGDQENQQCVIEDLHTDSSQSATPIQIFEAKCQS